MAKICLNMIVRNEAARIKRCLDSVAPYIDCYSITDTGSTDETLPTIIAYFAEKNIPGHVHSAPFENFEQARNAALANARSDPLQYNYLLLVDADMVLVVEDKDFKSKLTDVSYDVVQRASTLHYFNKRLVRRDQTGGYIGVTHEYLNIPGHAQLSGVYFIDHADGSNRKEKFKRDIKLLLKALEKEPKNERYVFYLAQSYRDAGQQHLAAAAYKKRVAMGGWDQEVWDAQVNYAHCLDNLGDEAGFIKEMLVAYNMRPSRAESVYDLAKHYRIKGMNHIAADFAEIGMRIPRTTDVLFVSDYTYTTGLKEEFSISAFYDPARRARGFAVCNALALDLKGTDGSRELARGNLFHYLLPLSEKCSSFRTRQIAFTPPDGYVAMNPSVARESSGISVAVRCVNYTMDEAGRYLIRGTDGECNGTNPIHTRNYYVQLNNELETTSQDEILPPGDLPPPAFNLVIGFEDMRLFEWQGGLWCSSTVRELNAQGMCEQVLARIGGYTTEYQREFRLCNWTKMLPRGQRVHEKNWMPQVVDNKLQFMYHLNHTVDSYGRTLKVTPLAVAADHMRGGSQVIPFRTGWLALVHEARVHPGNGKRYYQHRFVWFDTTNVLRRISAPFFFHDKQIEFAAGLAWHPDQHRLLISYGVQDKEAWIATIDSTDVCLFAHGVDL